MKKNRHADRAMGLLNKQKPDEKRKRTNTIDDTKQKESSFKRFLIRSASFCIRSFFLSFLSFFSSKMIFLRGSRGRIHNKPHLVASLSQSSLIQTKERDESSVFFFFFLIYFILFIFFYFILFIFIRYHYYYYYYY